ncbi:MAG: hypothetical protein ABS863_02990, partial [Aerococcus urinaeequi]
MKQKATWFLLLSTSLLLGSCSWFNNAEDIYDESETSSSEQVSSSASDETSEDSQSSQLSSTAESDTDDEASESSSSEVAPALTVTDYFPMIEGYQAVFEGDGNEFAGFTRTYDFINDEFL